MQLRPYGDTPRFVLGFRVRNFARVLTWFILSLVAFIIMVKLTAIYPEPHVQQSVTQNYFTGGFYFTPNIAGVVLALFLVADISLVISAMLFIVVSILFFRVGQLDLYDDYAIWKKIRTKRQITYDQMEDVYLGYFAASSASPTGMYGLNNPPMFMETASFYIGKRKFSFNINKQPEVAKFIEQKVPKANIDVDEFTEDDSDTASSS
jgi:hypothetical protein